MSEFYALVENICLKDKRYKPDAYEFVMQGLYFTRNKLKRSTHVSGKELACGLRDFAVDKYGVLAKTLLNHWGITKTLDFGVIVFNMIESKLFAKTPEDTLADFENVYDFDAVFSNLLKKEDYV